MKINLTDGFPNLRKTMLLSLMRLFLLLFCTTVFSFSSVDLLSQNAIIRFDTDKELTVDQVFDEIIDQTDYTFLYQIGIFDGLPKVKVRKGKIKANKLLEISLPEGYFRFGDGGRNVIVIERITQEDDRVNEIIGQQIVSGKVTDSNKLPLAGVTVLINDNERGTATDIDGNYSIRISFDDKISFSYLGFAMQEFIFNNQKEINVVLIEDSSQLDEVVLISSGYQEISRERATGAYGFVSKSQLEKPSSNISERLVGMVSGLQSTVKANGTIDFEIRGQSSLFADARPLIVLDGFPVEDGFNNINPNDVESITVLKDAAAASIWGAKSANGVIVITTKKAEKGRTKVSISSFVKFASKLDLNYVIDRASAADVLEYEQRAWDTGFFGGLGANPPGNSNSSVKSYSQALIAMNEFRLGMITEAERDGILNKLRGLDNSNQIKKYLLQTPLTIQHNIGITGGTETMRNKLSLLYQDNKTFFRGDNKEEYLINYTTGIKIVKNLDFDFSGMMQFNNSTRSVGGLGTIRNLAPWDMLVNDDGSLTELTHLKYYTPNIIRHIPTELFPYDDWSYNPIQEADNSDLTTKDLNARIQTGLTWEIIKGFSLSSKIQYEMFTSDNKNHYNDNMFEVRDLINQTSGNEWLSGDASTQLIANGGILEHNKSTATAYNFRNQLNFDRTFNSVHRINLVAGSEISSRVIKNTVYPNTFGYNNETLTSNELLKDLGTALDFRGRGVAGRTFNFNLRPNFSFTERTDRFFSLFGNVAYTYNDKYTITGSYRTDASNIISDDPKLRYDPFWSVGFGWQVGKEKFLADVNWIDRLNIRGTYGKNGNIDRSTSFKPLITMIPNLDEVTGQQRAQIGSYGNPSLRWETTKTYNLGLDFSIFRGKLHGGLNVYKKMASDLIVTESISGVNGTGRQKFNNGKMLNKGFEVDLGTTFPINDNNIVWSGAITFAYNKNEITSLKKYSYVNHELHDGGTQSYVEGYDANTLWSYTYGGMINTGSEENPVLQPSLVWIDGEKLPIVTVPLSGNGLEFMEPQGTTVAPTIFGMRNSFKIYDFDLSFIVTAKFGHVFRRQHFNYPRVSSGNSRLNSKYFEVANGDPNEIIPIPESEPRYYLYDRTYRYMSYLTENASHIRFQEVNLTYSLPVGIIDKLGIDKANIYAQANNVGVILFNDFGEDPVYPKETIRPQPTLTVGIQINF